MKDKSLKKQILLVLIFFTISVIVVIGILSVVNIYNSKIDLIKFNQNLVLKQVNTKVSSLVDQVGNISNYIRKNYFLKNKEFTLKDILEVNNDVSSVLILNSRGILENLYTKSDLNQNIYKGFDYSNKEYYKEIKNRNDYWSNVFLSVVNESPAISYSFKMGGKIGVVLINLTQISDFILKFKNQDESYMIRVFDRNGVLIMNPDKKEYVSQRLNANSSEVFTKLIRKNEPLQQDIFYSIIDEKEQFGSYLKNDKTGWYIIVRESYEKILNSLNSIIVTYFILIFIFIFIAVYLSFKISKKIFNSFDKIHDMTSKIANGNYDTKIEKSNFKEFNRLLESFSKMQKKIDKREESLEKSLNSFKSLFNSTMECVVLSLGYKIIDVNDITLKLFKLKSKEEVLGKDVFDYIMDDYKDLVAQNFKKSIEQPYEVEFIKSDGTVFHGLVQGKFLELNGERIRVSALIDISEVKNKDKLLFQQSKMASMGEMIGNIAHQWRQPLNVISTSASSVKLEKEFGILEDNHLNESMDIIVQNALYLSKTIDDFRNFFKIDKESETFEVKNIVQKALKLLNSSTVNENINVITYFLDKKINIDGYPNEFIQVVINTINNSRDAFSLNKIKTKIIEIKEEIDSTSYKLHIIDNAGGIPDDIIYKVFDPYFTTKHKSQGTGIGLYMSHQIIVDHMKGDFYVENVNFKYEEKSYRGCCFTIELPLNTSINYIYEI